MPHIAMCQALRRPHPLSRSRVALCRELRLPAVSDEWDNGKAAENLRKHGVDFVDAIAALEDLNRLEELDTQFVALNAMTDEEVVAAALSDSDAQPLTPEQSAKMRRVSRVKDLRQRLGMTQMQFAEAFHLLRDWEQHRSTPDAQARAGCGQLNVTPRSCGGCWRKQQRSVSEPPAFWR
jgi:DNA-binding transcriptional regulator YiaG